MSVSVLKYGGSSVSNFDQIKDIARYIQKRVDQGDQCIVVVSAMGKTTDQLLASVANLTPDPKNEDLALLLSTGEQQSVSYLSLVLNDLGVKSKSLTGYQAGIQTSGHVLKSKIKAMDPGLFHDKLKDYDCLVVAGFQGVNQDSDMTTLGRGGSDTTAVAIAASLKAPCEIYTDVPGVFATDPRIFPSAPKLELITYEEMMELSALGAGVLESRSVEIAKNYGVKIYLGQTLSDQGGTWVVAEEELFEKKAVTGVALDMGMSHITMTYPEQNIVLLRRLFEFLQENEINVDMISQIDNDQALQFSFTYQSDESNTLSHWLQDLKEDYPDLTYVISNHYAKISLVGSGMREMSGVASKAFMALINQAIPFYQTTTSEISISYVIDRDKSDQAVASLCQAFGITEEDIND